MRVELWNGAANDWDKQLLRSLEAVLPTLPLDEHVWQAAVTLAERARTSGLNVPATDLVIFWCARVNGCELEHVDRHYELLDLLEKRR